MHQLLSLCHHRTYNDAAYATVLTMARKTKAIFSPEDRLVLLGAYEDGMDGVGKEKCEKLDRTSVQLGKSSEEVRVSVIRKHGLKCTTLL